MPTISEILLNYFLAKIKKQHKILFSFGACGVFFSEFFLVKVNQINEGKRARQKKNNRQGPEGGPNLLLSLRFGAGGYDSHLIQSHWKNMVRAATFARLCAVFADHQPWRKTKPDTGARYFA